MHTTLLAAWLDKRRAFEKRPLIRTTMRDRNPSNKGAVYDLGFQAWSQLTPVQLNHHHHLYELGGDRMITESTRP